MAGTTYNGSNSSYALVRYNISGDLDYSFGSYGVVTTAFLNANDEVTSLAIQNDEKVLAAGFSYNGSNNDFALVRYNHDGILDNTFGSNGTLIVPIRVGIGAGNDQAYSIAIQKNGKILEAGYSSNGFNNDFAIIRSNPNGFMDETFGTKGIVTTDIGSFDDIARSIIIQSDSKIVAVGYSYNGSNYGFALARYDTSGSLDNAFGTNGKEITLVGLSDAFAYSAAIQKDGKIVAAGISSLGSNYGFSIVRYKENGSLDSSFGNGGIVATNIGNTYDLANSVQLQEDGKIVVAGYSMINNQSEFAVVRYNTNGSLDSGFGTGGIVTTSIGDINDYGQSVALQSDGKIVVTGYSYIGNNPVLATVRYNSNGTLDNTFGANGKLTTSIGTSQSYANSLAIDGNGKILVGGYSSNGSNYSVLTLVRYNGSTQTEVKGDNNSATPMSFVLEQNYPNPFNPSTSIRYSIPKTSLVILKVYDILGREVATLVNEEKPIGTYQINFDASSLASGIYFYKIQAGSFTQTKKMILLK